jgi:hypothetical protein
MYDPNTLAFEFRFPLGIEIWHVDPCIGGDDNSSGWVFPHLTDVQGARAMEIAREWKIWLPVPYYDIGWSCVEIVRATWGDIKWYEKRTHSITVKEMDRIWSLASNPVDNLQMGAKRAIGGDHDDVEQFIGTVYRNFLSYHRPWYRHPRWHFWRWRVHIRALGITFGREAGDVEMDW